MKLIKTLGALALSIALLLFVVPAFAATYSPDNCEGNYPGMSVSATVGEYHEIDKTFNVTLYTDDTYALETVEKFAPGDVLLLGGKAYTVAENIDQDGTPAIKTEDGWEIAFWQKEDDADHAVPVDFEDDRRYMHAFAVLQLPAAEGITLEDASNPDLEAEPVVYTGLEEILKVKAEKEENSNGLNYYATTITLNDQLEIASIHVNYDVAQ